MTAGPRILALETTGNPGGLLLAEGDHVREVHRFTAPHRHNEELMPLVDAATRRLGWPPASADLLLVNRGPGSATGLRVGLVTAQMLAVVTGAEVLALDALAVLAAGARGKSALAPPALLVGLLDAKRGELYAAVYAVGSDVEPGPPLLGPGAFRPDAVRDALAARWPGETLWLVGSGRRLVDWSGALPSARPHPDAPEECTPEALYRLGWARARAGARSDSRDLEPLYLRAPLAKTADQVKAERRPADDRPGGA